MERVLWRPNELWLGKELVRVAATCMMGRDHDGFPLGLRPLLSNNDSSLRPYPMGCRRFYDVPPPRPHAIPLYSEAAWGREREFAIDCSSTPVELHQHVGGSIYSEETECAIKSYRGVLPLLSLHVDVLAQVRRGPAACRHMLVLLSASLGRHA
ncbi:uncharacterized protein VTP21DRAFT_9515 [Calcarisporiella thermophila]|uniref:uncharacterized protein n=1 Tax=Calcarisporiella thermophila TaxID=911321 RepID=UPI003742C8FB